jgi:exonuclease VII large subunit
MQSAWPINLTVPEGELRAYPSAYALDKREIPLSDPAAVAAALSGGNLDADLVAVVRGGSDMRALSDRQVVEAVAYHMPIPIVSAVGHDVVQPLIQDVVHWAFATPTAFGTWLADRAKGAIRAREAMALDHTRALEAMQRQLTELSEVATAAKLAETAAREAATQLAETAAQKAAAQAREETGRLRQELQESESRRQTMRYMTAAMGAVLLVVLVILVFILAM